MQITGSSRIFQDGVTAASGTANAYVNQLIRQKTISAINSGVITPNASSLVIEGPPIAGTNQTITNPYAILVQTGASRFNGPITLAQSSTAKTINLLAASGVTNNYSLTLPTSTPPSSGQALISDTSGNLSWGSVSSAATQSTFSAANNVTSPATVNGLTASISPLLIPVYVSLIATNNLVAIVHLQIYYNTSLSSYILDSTYVGDNTGVRFDITSAGQVVYYSGNYAGFSSLTFTWYQPYTPVSSVTTSLNLLNNLNVGTSTILASSATSGVPSNSSGGLLYIQGSTFTDTNTAASGSTVSFNGTFIAAPSLAAQNTGVTTTNASTFTIAGAPVASTNQTITNLLAMNVLSGLSLFGGNIAIGTTAKNTQISNNPNQTTSYTLTLPTSLPTTSRQALISDTSGNISFTNVLPGTLINTANSSGQASTSGVNLPSGGTTVYSFTYNKVSSASLLDLTYNMTVYSANGGVNYNIRVFINGTFYFTYQQYINSGLVRIPISFATIIPQNTLPAGNLTIAAWGQSDGGNVSLYSFQQILVREYAG